MKVLTAFVYNRQGEIIEESALDDPIEAGDVFRTTESGDLICRVSDHFTMYAKGSWEKAEVGYA